MVPRSPCQTHYILTTLGMIQSKGTSASCVNVAFSPYNQGPFARDHVPHPLVRQETSSLAVENKGSLVWFPRPCFAIPHEQVVRRVWLSSSSCVPRDRKPSHRDGRDPFDEVRGLALRSLGPLVSLAMRFGCLAIFPCLFPPWVRVAVPIAFPIWMGCFPFYSCPGLRGEGSHARKDLPKCRWTWSDARWPWRRIGSRRWRRTCERWPRNLRRAEKPSPRGGAGKKGRADTNARRNPRGRPRPRCNEATWTRRRSCKRAGRPASKRSGAMLDACRPWDSQARRRWPHTSP